MIVNEVKHCTTFMLDDLYPKKVLTVAQTKKKIAQEDESINNIMDLIEKYKKPSDRFQELGTYREPQL